MFYKALMLCAGVTVLAGCGAPNSGTSDSDVADVGVVPQESAPPPDATARVELAATRGHTANGLLTLIERANGVAVAGSIRGLDPDGTFAFHVHENGDCSAPDASSAGEHFNPTGQPHGGPDTTPRHLGDMPNIEANDEGVAEVDVTLDDVTLTGAEATSLANRAIVVHANPDDYTTQPSGGAGDRIACGVISMATMAMMSH